MAYHNIFQISPREFEPRALEIFRVQALHNKVYRDYLAALSVNPQEIVSLQSIPYLPIRFFKTQKVVTGEFEPQAVFESSGTTGMVSSKHYVADLALYEESFLKGFERFYGAPRDWRILGLLPSYLERKNSSLVYMTRKLIELSGHPESGFYLDEYDKLALVLKELEGGKEKTWMIGVSFALLDLAKKFPQPLRHTVIVETGGMKGRREEMLREELHAQLKDAFQLEAVHSEYGMTELLSQAYSKGNGVFETAAWMKLLVRDEEDPFLVKQQGRGTVNIIDLANIHSCCFIATDDVGSVNQDGSFQILGRVDGSDLRGCSLMVV